MFYKVVGKNEKFFNKSNNLKKSTQLPMYFGSFSDLEVSSPYPVFLILLFKVGAKMSVKQFIFVLNQKFLEVKRNSSRISP